MHESPIETMPAGPGPVEPGAFPWTAAIAEITNRAMRELMAICESCDGAIAGRTGEEPVTNGR